jgi:site-specific DNA-methyltransferase (adenine-specific)
MGKRWDYDVPSVDVWAECIRVLKPGGHLLAFAGTRTQHRMAVRIEDAGFEIRDMIAWVYGSGFPKSLDVSKAIDKAAGAEREVVHTRKRSQVASEGWDRPWKQEAMKQAGGTVAEYTITAPATDAARQWQGWGTALKPAMEPITVARKPLIGTVAANVLEHGTGAINVDGCRVGHDETLPKMSGKAILGGSSDGWDRPWKNDPDGLARRQSAADAAIEKCNALGRWPANLIHDGSEEVTELLSDSARFFYCAKASKRDRDEGLQPDVISKRQGDRPGSPDETGKFPDHDHRERTGNFHPTVKPTDLMRYLCRLVTAPNGTILDPFTGSGSTGKAAMLEGFQFIGIEREAEYVEIAKARIEAVKK